MKLELCSGVGALCNAFDSERFLSLNSNDIHLHWNPLLVIDAWRYVNNVPESPRAWDKFYQSFRKLWGLHQIVRRFFCTLKGPLCSTSDARYKLTVLHRMVNKIPTQYGKRANDKVLNNYKWFFIGSLISGGRGSFDSLLSPKILVLAVESLPPALPLRYATVP